MKLDRAIDILEQDLTDNLWSGASALEPALKLGIEALKRIQVLRAPGPKEEYRLLPGETKE